MRVLLLERGKLVIGRLVDDHMIFDPAHLALAGLGFEEAASVLDYFKRLSIRNQGDAVRYGGNPVSQVGLLRHHVDHLGLGTLAQTGASAQRGHQSDADRRARQRNAGRRGGGATMQQTYERRGLPVSIRPDFLSRCITEFIRERFFLMEKETFPRVSETPFSYPHQSRPLRKIALGLYVRHRPNCSLRNATASVVSKQYATLDV